MTDWLLLLRAARFRGFWLALLLVNLGNWCVIAALPILVAERFGAGMELVLSLGLRVLPKLLLAPLGSRLLSRFGAARVAASAMLANAVLTAALPWCGSVVALQAVIAVTGTLDLFVNPGLLALRGAVTPAGMEMAGNTLYSVADRAAKVVGPAIGGLAVVAGLRPAFAGFAVLIAMAAVPVLRLPDSVRGSTERTDRLSLAGFVRLVRSDRQITGLLVASTTYMVMLGGLRPFLFWANRDWYGASDSGWTGLLTAQGAGALIGAIAAGLFVQRLTRAMSAFMLSMVTGVLEGLAHLLLLFAATSAQAIAILALAGIPEVISAAAWFTAIQVRLPSPQQGGFYTFAAPLWDASFALGIASAGLHAAGVLSLSGYWALVSLTATLPLLPLMVTRRTGTG
ncbi:MAG: hypothetical protein B7Z80_10840 [Rhodospirillales bacterium 20-64-7]|nr:MAG: hypothetical protein B7Z80_10840 [Rhodospirillales bacterium 20-64-7]HQT76317.1 MFS transporter [Rhodopila sp.]